MARETASIDALCKSLIADIRDGRFAPVYLLMGEEPYYPDLVCDEIVSHALSDGERDFNQRIFFGLDSTAGQVASEARSYPMMADRRLVVLKEAQAMKTLEDLALYCAEPMESTVLVILMHGVSADKRKSLYKTVSKVGVVLDSPQMKDYQMQKWIASYYESRGLSIEPEAVRMLADYAGADLGKIALETDKMLKNLPEGARTVRVGDVEKNVGISRQFSIFELTKLLSFKDSASALRVAAYLGESKQFFLPAAIGALFTHFYRILRYGALLLRSPHVSDAEKASVLSVNPYFMKEYDMAVRNYPLPKAMRVIALLTEYDYKSKGGGAGEAGDAELLKELVSKILNV